MIATRYGVRFFFLNRGGKCKGAPTPIFRIKFKKLKDVTISGNPKIQDQFRLQLIALPVCLTVDR